jgi:Uma2 family endonuclease
MTTFTLDIQSILELTDDQFFELCQRNRDLKFERTSTGELIIMTPTGGETSNSNAGLTSQLWMWNDRTKLGKVFDSSGGFKLPNGADRSPDASWVKLDRWEALTLEQRQKFPPLCPDFVVELLSPSDNLKTTQEKMREYLENGARLGWLINRKNRQVEIYRSNRDVEVLDVPTSLSGEEVLAGFVLKLESIW